MHLEAQGGHIPGIAFDGEMLEAGHILGRYRIEAPLGAGGMGEVYRAWDATLRRRVALKVVAVDESGRAQRLVGEARAAAALHHPNIVAVYDVGEAEGHAFVCMDLVEGKTLRQVIGDTTIPTEQRLAWLVQIASALVCAHRAGIVHRDVKPENVMIDLLGNVRVLDFGLAKAFAVDVHGATQHPDASPPSFRTGEGHVSGTPAYMAPEQLAGAPASPAWDQYAWGVMGYELLTGKHPRVAGLIDASGWAKPADSVAPVPPEIGQVVARAMAPTPDQRFASMEAVVLALGGTNSTPASAASDPPRAASVRPTPTPTPDGIGTTLQVPVHPNAPAPQRRAGTWKWIAGTAAILVGGVFVYRLQTHQRTTTQTAIPSVVLASASAIASTSAGTPAIASAIPSASASATASTNVVVPPRPIIVSLTGQQSLQYDAAVVDRIVRAMRPLVQSCVNDNPPAKLPKTINITLELWNISNDLGKVRDVHAAEPLALVRCLHDVFLPLSFGPPKNPTMPPSAVFVRIQADR